MIMIMELLRFLETEFGIGYKTTVLSERRKEMNRNDLIKLLLDKSSDEDEIAIAVLTDDGTKICSLDNLKRYTNGKYFEIDLREQ